MNGKGGDSDAACKGERRSPKRRQFRYHGLGCYLAAEPFGGAFDLRPVDQQNSSFGSGTLLVVGVPVSAVSGILQNEQGAGAAGDVLVAGQIRHVAECADGGMILEQHLV